MTTGEIVRGDLTQTIRVRSTDEIGQLASAFGQMLEKLREIPLRLHTSTQLLSTVVESFRVQLGLARGYFPCFVIVHR